MPSETDGFIEVKPKHDSTDRVVRDVSSQEVPEGHLNPELET
jgi:hypothetical protein